MQILFVCLIFYYLYGDPRDLPVLTHSFPTRRSSDLGIQRDPGQPGARRPPGRGHPPAGQPPGPLRRIWRLWQRPANLRPLRVRSEEHTSELQSLMRISYAVFCLKKKKTEKSTTAITTHTIKKIKPHKKQ